jgi:sigma-B regulation protein RsbU (phosphoserine phosphatase)
MKQPLTDANMPPHVLLDDCLRAVVRWSRTSEPAAQWRSQVGPEIWKVRVNDFPEEHLYTLFVDDEVIGDFDEWPRQWLRVQEESNQRSGAHGLQPDIDAAATAQGALLTPARPFVPGLDVYVCHRPLESVTSDFCEILASGGHETMIVMGDACGKGVSAAIYGMRALSHLRALARPELSPAELLAQLNLALKQSRAGSEYATLLVFVWRSESRSFVIANAGAPAPAVLHNGELDWVRTAGPGIGSPASSDFEQIDLSVSPGDLLVLCSDGISGQEGGSGEAFYGDHRLAETIRRAGQCGVDHVAQALLADLDEFRAGVEQCDDQTIVVIRVK